MADDGTGTDTVVTTPSGQQAVMPPPPGQSSPLYNADPATPYGGLIDPKKADEVTKTQAHDLRAFLDQRDRADRNMAQNDEQIAEAQRRLINQEGATLDKMPKWDQGYESQKYSHNLWEQFGSPGFVIGMLASAFSGNPMMSAMEAGAGAMNAINQGDTEAYHRAFDAFKFNSDLALKRMDMEKDIFSQYGNLRETNQSEWAAQMRAAFAKFDDQRLLTMLDAGYNKEIDDVLESRISLQEKAMTASNDLKENYAKQLIYQQLVGDSKDPKKISQAWQYAEELAKAPTTPEQFALHNLLQSKNAQGVSFIDQPFDEQNKQIMDTINGLRSKQLLAQQEITDKATIRAGLKAKHPEWDDEKLTTETNQEYAQSKHVESAANKKKLADEQAIEDAIKADPKFANATPDQIVLEKYKRLKAARSGVDLDDDSANLIADQYLAGDRMAATGFARNPAAMAKIRDAIKDKAKAQGLSGLDIAMRIAEFHGIQAAETAVGRRLATIQMFASEAFRVIGVAERAESEVPRGEFVPFNRAMIAYENNTGDPKTRALGAALNAVINTYAKAINGGQQGTVSDKEHAREIVEAAYSHQQMYAVFHILKQELQAALDAPSDVKAGLRSLATSNPAPAADTNIIDYDENGKRITK